MREDKIELMLHAMEHPEDYSDERLEELFSDEEVRESYELSVLASRSLGRKRIITTAVNDSYHGGNSRLPRWELSAIQKVAAVFLGILMLSGIAYAAVRVAGSLQEERRADATSTHSEAPAMKTVEALPADTTLTFENEELAQVVARIAAHYQVDMEFRSEQARHLRIYTKWMPAEPLQQVVERLNGFEKVNVELNHNTLIIE